MSKSSIFSSYPEGWKEDFSDYPFREWEKIGEILPQISKFITGFIESICLV